VKPRLALYPEALREQMGVEVAEEKTDLKEQQAGGPDGRRAAEGRQYHLADHRLHQKQQCGAEKDRARVG